MSALRQIIRGSDITWPVKVPVGTWNNADKILFGAKRSYDKDNTDAKAILKKTLTAANIDSTDADYVTLTLSFSSFDTSEGVAGTYIAQFKYVDSNDKVTPYVAFELDIIDNINNRNA